MERRKSSVSLLLLLVSGCFVSGTSNVEILQPNEATHPMGSTEAKGFGPVFMQKLAGVAEPLTGSRPSWIPPARNLGGDDGDDDDYYIAEEDMYSFSGFSLKYAKCQAIQRFSEDAIQNGEYSAMVKDDVVILRLCPTNQCSSNKEYGCHYNYAEYAIGISDYVKIMLRYTVQKRQNLCNYCAECGAYGNGNRRLQDDEDEDENDRDEEDDKDEDEEDDNDEDEEDGEEDGEDEGNFDDDDYYALDDDNQGGGDGDGDGGGGDDYVAEENGQDDAAEEDACGGYSDDCATIANWCNGQADDDAGYLDYLDYMDFLDCVKVEGQDQYGDAAYWIKPRCDPYQGTIMMSIFYDPYCSQYAGDEVNLREFSGIYFRTSIFEDFYDTGCIDCSESNYGPFYNSNSNMCNKLHASSAQCTDNMMYQLFDDEDDDSIDCSFIESVRFGTYNEKGEIYIDSSQFGESVRSEVTPAQKAGLVVSILLCVGLGIYSCYLHHSITNLLIKSLSHSHLLPPSRHRTRGKNRRSSRNGREGEGEEDWDRT